MDSSKTSNSADGSTNSCLSSKNSEADSDSEQAKLIYSCSNANLYFINNNGMVSVSSGPETVRIFEIEDVGKLSSVAKYYLQVDTFVYPLVNQVSPCVRTEYGAIVLPNINREQCPDNQSIAVIVPREYEEEFILILENILGTKIVYCDTRRPESVTQKISSTIISGAECVSNLLIQGAQKAEQFMDGNTPRLIENITPGERPRRVNPCVKSGIKIAKDVTSITANVTGFVASTVGAATMSLGQFLAPHIRNHGSKLLSQAPGMTENKAQEKVNTILNVTASTVGGLGVIYDGLEQSARIFGQSLSNNTVHIVKHRYGRPAAEFTQDTFETVSNGIEIGTHLKFFKPSNIAKSTVKQIIKAESNTPQSGANSSVDGSAPDSLIDVDVDSIRSGSSDEIKPPMPFYSSEILQPTVISPTRSTSGIIEPTKQETVSNSTQTINGDLL